MDFEKTCMLFAMREPYYGILLSSMERFPSRKFPTLGVTRSGNVFRLVYNPDFIEPLPTEAVLELLKHEVLHLAFNHFTLFDTEPASSRVAQLQNIAADMEINGYLDTTKLSTLHPVLASAYGWENKLGTREYFRRLLQKDEEDRKRKDKDSKDIEKPDTDLQAHDGEYDDDSGEGSSIYTEDKLPECLDDHSIWPAGDSDSDNVSLTQQIEDMLVFAADEVEKGGRGEIPGELIGKINLIRERKRVKPVADWKRYCRRYLGNAFSEMTRRTMKRPSRRFAGTSGTRRLRKSRILVAIDTSGSVSMREYNEFFAQIDTLTSAADFRVIECDARIQHEYEYRGKPNGELHGGGGTSFAPVIDYFIGHRREFDALVYFTDGYAPIPGNTPKDTLWVVSSHGDQTDRGRYRMNGASVAFIPKQKA